jgi:HAD superfamily hydrolase (TIGR01509 family)
LRCANRTKSSTILAHCIVSGQPDAHARSPEVARLTKPNASSLPTPEGLIFDLDGTLVDTVGARIAGWITALAEAGIEAAGDEIAPKIGMDGRRLAREVATTRGRTLDAHATEAIDHAAGAAFDELNREPTPLPGLDELMARIDASGVPWVIATSSRREQVSTSVASLGLRKPPTIVDGSHVEHAKPAPDLLLLASERLGVAPQRCWSIGDSTWDMLASAAAGMTPVGVLAGSVVTEKDLRHAGARTVVSTLAELATLLETVRG